MNSVVAKNKVAKEHALFRRVQILCEHDKIAVVQRFEKSVLFLGMLTGLLTEMHTGSQLL